MSGEWSLSQKTELLRSYLEQRGARVPSGSGKRKMRCAFPERHARGDRRPSAEINLTTGRYTCYSCHLSGDVYDLLQELDGLTFKQAQTSLGGVAPIPEEEVWI